MTKPAIERYIPSLKSLDARRRVWPQIHFINELTGDLKLSQVQLGHKRLSTTANIYTHTNVRQIERAGEVLADAILSTK